MRSPQVKFALRARSRFGGTSDAADVEALERSYASEEEEDVQFRYQSQGGYYRASSRARHRLPSLRQRAYLASLLTD